MTLGMRPCQYLTLFLLASLAAPAAQASSLGRLFFTPQQRAQLEPSHTRNSATEEESRTSVLLVNGIVQNKGGARTVWINGVAHHADKSDERNPEAVQLAVPGKTKTVHVKVGQQLLLDHRATQNPPMPGK